ncbi:hypothetical protein LUZ62_019751 [Rhynchospora pubera]|uniref:Uncharacterized protein n=1 Tax=Rhynchospora pubera TaxID=906938 RepID=A0AAV8GNE7_9POAL|nr:hypothetical protein LUZ62_019751 [Rhynchospora pubera]
MEIQEVAIDIHVPSPENADELQIFMKKKLDEVPGEPFKPRPVTIFRLPTWLHEINKDLCGPKVVSIGPYHHGKECLQAMQKHKWSMLRDFLARDENSGFEMYLREMRLLEAQARECYSETVDMGSDDFVMMLLLDGCFILELLLKLQTEEWDLCSVDWVCGDIISDLCMLENQMPFFVIHKLFAIQGKCDQNCEGLCPLFELISVKIWIADTFKFSAPQISCSEIHHLLHLYYKGVLPDRQFDREQSDLVTGKSYHWRLQIFQWSKFFSKSSNPVVESATSRDDESTSSEDIKRINIPCVTELHEAGVKFRRKIQPRDMFDISFQHGTMEMPFLGIDDMEKILLWNMVAFEQSQPYEFESERILSSYLALMDSLINTEKDAAILGRSGIFENYLHNDEQAANFFNQFSKIFLINYSDHYFYGLYKDIKRYSESACNKSRAQLKHDYFSNPWSSISVVAASILLILTFIQTYYSAAK